MSFKYRNLSSDDFGMVFFQLPPIPLPQRRKEKQYVPARSGYLTYDDKAWDEFSLEFGGHFFITSTVTLQKVKDWLKVQGNLEYITATAFYQAEVMNQVNFEFITPTLVKFYVLFWCQPFLYHKSGLTPITLTKAQIGTGYTLTNSETNIESEPVIEVHGTGNQTLTINGKVITMNLGSDTLPIVLNSRSRIVTKGSQSAESSVIGELPTLEASNLIKVSSGITKLVITPHWRSV